ncbi:MAG: sulfatase [Gammaproteobacteria bacterium]|nr:sulfatase [Gammaproteobacteria bacterium]
MDKPKNAIVILLDSLNRHMLGAYGGDEFETPNIDRFAARSTRFEKHFVGSLPCMPARHDILGGALDFLWKPWGSIELWEEAITQPLREQGVTTMLVSDHPHLFETGGENYHTEFRGWEYVRGHENDPWKTRPDPSWAGAPALPAGVGLNQRYNTTRTWFREELDFPGPRTMQTAADWLDENAGFHDRFLLFIDEFDPHEPFDTPEPWANKYDPDWSEELIIWPPYSVKTVERGVINARQAKHVRANYGSKLSMIDHWFGKLMDAVDKNGLWDDTVVILCTDHGHYLGERDIFGKPGVPHFEPMGHTPLMMHLPGVAAGSVAGLTTNVDINATLYDIFDLTPRHRTHGVSLLPLVRGETTSVREWALSGVWGRWVHVFDGNRKYARAPVNDDNLPLSLWSNRWSTMPIVSAPRLKLPNPDRRAYLDYMPGSDIPVIRQPYEPGDGLPYWCAQQPINWHCLYDIDNDPEEAENRLGGREEADMLELLKAALADVEAPEEQLQRLGIK